MALTQARKEYLAKWRLENREKLRAQKQSFLDRHPDYGKHYYAEHAEVLKAHKRALKYNSRPHVKAKKKEWAERNRETIRAKRHAHYVAHRQELLAKSGDRQRHNKVAVNACHRKRYWSNPERFRKYNRDHAKKSYCKNPEKAKARARDYRVKHPEQTKSSITKWRMQNREHVKAYAKGYRTGDPDAVRRRWRSYYERHRDELKAKGQRWKDENPERVRERARSSYQRNRAAIKIRSNRERVRRAGAVGGHTATEWLARIAALGYECFYCGKELTIKSVTKDHYVALINGGTDYVDNLVPACKSCNSRKRHRTAAVFFAVLGRTPRVL